MLPEAGRQAPKAGAAEIEASLLRPLVLAAPAALGPLLLASALTGAAITCNDRRYQGASTPGPSVSIGQRLLLTAD